MPGRGKSTSMEIDPKVWQPPDFRSEYMMRVRANKHRGRRGKVEEGKRRGERGEEEEGMIGKLTCTGGGSLLQIRTGPTPWWKAELPSLRRSRFVAHVTREVHESLPQFQTSYSQSWKLDRTAGQPGYSRRETFKVPALLLPTPPPSSSTSPPPIILI
eukprot:630166-Hanusia_phi.AAC.1